MFDTIRVEGNKEYFKRADGKIVYRFADETKDYRVDELHPEVIRQLDRAREQYNYPSKPMIDNLIKMQSQAVQKAVNYVKYRLLGECNYIEVFKTDFDREAEAAHQEAEIENLKRQIEDLTFICQTILQNMEKSS